MQSLLTLKMVQLRSIWIFEIEAIKRKISEQKPEINQHSRISHNAIQETASLVVRRQTNSVHLI